MSKASNPPHPIILQKRHDIGHNSVSKLKQKLFNYLYNNKMLSLGRHALAGYVFFSAIVATFIPV